MPDELKYVSGEEIRSGDHVRFHGHPAQIEFAASEMEDPQHGCFVRLYGGGVMVHDPAICGHSFIPVDQLRCYEDLEFVSRGDWTHEHSH